MVSDVEAKGLSGLSRCFRDAIEGLGKTGRVLFVGSPFTCLPFAEFLCYGIRDFDLKPCFMPSSEVGKIREIVREEGYGFQLGGKVVGVRFDIVVFLGGLAMPKYGVSPSALKEALLGVSDLKKTVAVCFQGSLKNKEWIETFRFSYIIDTDLRVTSETG